MRLAAPHRPSMLGALLALAIVCVPALALAGESKSQGSKLRHYAVGELADLVRSEGYGSVQVEENRVAFKADGSQYLLFLYDDGDLQLYYGLTGVSISTDDINAWNRHRRLSRAYIDTEQDPVLEADLLANAGMNDRIIAEFIKVFVGSASQFRSFLREHDRSGGTQPAKAGRGAGI